MALSKYSGLIVSLIVTSVLSRLLTPKDFGVVGVATVIIAFFNILGDIGVGPAVIQRDNLSRRDLKGIHTLTTLFGFLLATVFFFSSHIIADLYQDTKLVNICEWLSLTILFTCFGIVPLNLQYKKKEFKSIAYITLTIQIVVGIIAIFMAMKGYGVYALVSQSILSALFISLTYNLINRIGLTIRIEMESIKKILSFSTYQFMFNILAYISRNADKLLVGRYIGLTQLGYYEKSYRLMMMPLQNITFVITPVILPVFSSFKDNLLQLGEKYIRLLKPLSYISFSLSVILFFCSPELILIIFGPQWENSISPLQILSTTVGLQILTSTTGGIFQAANATKQLFQSGLFGASFMIASFLISIFMWHSIEAVCYAYVVAQLANTIQCFWMIFKLLGFPASTPLKIIIRPILISAVLSGALYIFNEFIPFQNLIGSLLIKTSLGLLIAALLIQLFSPYNLKTILSIIKNRNF